MNQQKRVLGVSLLAVSALLTLGTAPAMAQSADQPSNVELCKEGRWRSLGYVNEGQCVRAAAKGTNLFAASLSDEFLLSPNQSNPNGNWYFLRALSAHIADPTKYELLTDYRVVDANTQGWETAFGPSQTPLVRHIASLGTVFVHPGSEPWSPNLVIVGWKSPANVVVRVVGLLNDLQPDCGEAPSDGVDWEIRSGGVIVAKGSLENGGTQVFPDDLVVPLGVGDFVYVIVSPGAAGNFSCDSTELVVSLLGVD